MLDGVLRPLVDPISRAAAKMLHRSGLEANHVTLLAFALGLLSAISIVLGYMVTGLVFIVLSRLADGIDGAVARLTRSTDFGGYLDIVLDFAFYGLIPLAFILQDPQQNGLAGGLLLFSFYVNGASFLAYAALAAKRGLDGEVRGKKSIVFTTGLAEATETYAAFAAACLFPAWFPMIAYVFAAICVYTALARIIQASATFKD